MECPWGTPTIPSLMRTRGENREIGIWKSWLAGCCSSREPRLIGVTDADPPVGFCSGGRVGEFPSLWVCCCFEFGVFWSSGGWFLGFGVSRLRPVWPVSCTGLTGAGACLWKSSGLARVFQTLPVWPVVVTGLTGVVYGYSSCLFRCVLE
jgi:hypothetical protein